MEWSTGLDHWRGVAAPYACARLLCCSASSSREPRGGKKCVVYPLESTMADALDSNLQLGTENDPIVIEDSSPAGSLRLADQLLRSPVKILEGDQYRYAYRHLPCVLRLSDLVTFLD